MRVKIKTATLCAFLFAVNHMSAFAQCAMCKATLENQEDKGIAGSINEGILILMPIPYLLLAVIGGVFYMRHKKKKRNEAQ